MNEVEEGWDLMEKDAYLTVRVMVEAMKRWSDEEVMRVSARTWRAWWRAVEKAVRADKERREEMRRMEEEEEEGRKRRRRRS